MKSHAEGMTRFELDAGGSAGVRGHVRRSGGPKARTDVLGGCCGTDTGPEAVAGQCAPLFSRAKGAASG